VLSILAQRARAGLPLEIDSPALRDFIYVEDAATAVRLALAVPCAVGNVYNVGCGIATPLVELAALVSTATGSSSPIRPPPTGEATGYVADLTRSRADLGFAPTIALEEGLRRYVAWLSECPDPAESATDASTAGG
jgi:nucleoside-diphosphate-sugar epimerase